MAWKLINLKVALDVLERIDTTAHRLGMTRTAYIISRCDPGGDGTAVVVPTPDPRPSFSGRSKTIVIDSRAPPRVDGVFRASELLQVGPTSRAPGSMLKGSA